MNCGKTLVTKGDFARRMNRGPSAVSNWISAGKISAAALVGKGNSAKIWLEQAQADLAASLDPSQQVIQPSPILSAGSSAAPSSDIPLLLTAGASQEPLMNTPPQQQSSIGSRTVVTEREADLARRAKADADHAEHVAEAARRKLLVDEGRYVLAEEAARVWGRELAKLMSETETFVSSTLARQIAEAHGLDWKAIAVEMRQAFRQFRAGLSDDARARRETPPAGEHAEAEGAGEV